ncbi:Ubiquitin ligase protein FANCL [Zostera marina]|uniref:Ubiquitin ligase protein FANCL n=1 Tax=Zostera marina TaxID=29655 RepID=A0A0K9P7V9_ZOSMR|nr:Ubiquitin ligase protein FANCL [Zostera marina]
MERQSEKARHRSSFYAAVYSEIEEVGWESLVRSEEDLTALTFRISDKKGETHFVDISLPQTYPQYPPSISADVPYNCDLHWSKTSRLKDVLEQFSKHVDSLQEFWSTINHIDRTLCVIHPNISSRSAPIHQINLGNECHLLLSVNPYKPRSLPKCRFLGPDNGLVDLMIKKWKKNSHKWNNSKTISENFTTLLEITFPGPSNVNAMEEDDKEIECGICYAQHLPVDDELKRHSGAQPDYICDNSNCNRVFHTICLKDWLRSITTTRRSFDILFGNCPYCSDPVAVKVNDNNH